MNAVVATEIQKALAEFSRSSTVAARRTMIGVRRLDRKGEVDERFFVMFEAACLLVDNQSEDSVRLLRTIAPLSISEWNDLLDILKSAREYGYKDFVAVCADLPRRVDSTPGSNKIEPPRPPPRDQSVSMSQASAGSDGSTIASLMLGICSLLGLCQHWALAIPFGIVGLTLGIHSGTKGVIRTIGISSSLAGLVLGALVLILERILHVTVSLR